MASKLQQTSAAVKAKPEAKSRQSKVAPVAPTLDLERSVPVLVTILANRITTSGSMTFRKHHGLGSTDWKVLSTIAIEPDVTGARIAQVVGLDRAAVSRVLKGFVELKLIEVKQSTRHSNYQSVTLTPVGRALHDEAIVTAFEREKILLAPFSAKERIQLVNFLNRLIAQSRMLMPNGE